MKFLLAAVNAKYIHSNPGVYSLQTHAKELGKHVEIAEYTINSRSEEILADIYRRKPDVMGFSCYIWNIGIILEIVTELHKIMPKLPIWLGGPEVSFDARELLQRQEEITGIMVGEGEETFRELLECYLHIQEKENLEFCEIDYIQLKHIRGLVMPNGSTNPRTLMTMDAIPFPYGGLEEFENRIVYYESSRGCPFSCSYCLSSIDRTTRLRGLELVKKELQIFLDAKVPQVKFVDRTFNCNHAHAMGIWNYILENDNGITNFHFEVAADIMSEEEIELLQKMRPGAVQLEIGVQSTNERTIREIRRTMDLDKVRDVVGKILAAGNIHIHLDLIAGLPYEDYRTFQKSFGEVYAMRPDQLQLGFLKVLKGSYMHQMAGEYGIEYTSRPPYEVLCTRWLPYQDVRKLKQIEEMVELYYNSGQFKHTLRFLEKEFETSFDLYRKLAKFYEKKGYFKENPSRIHRYEVLLSFVEEKIPDKTSLFAQLLTLDVYARENSKTRPAFARDLLPFREETRRFYQEEEKAPKFLTGYQNADARQMARMTHIEVFTFDVAGTGEELLQPTYLLFDYQDRNPLTKEAKMHWIL